MTSPLAEERVQLLEEDFTPKPLYILNNVWHWINIYQALQETEMIIKNHKEKI